MNSNIFARTKFKCWKNQGYLLQIITIIDHVLSIVVFWSLIYCTWSFDVFVWCKLLLFFFFSLHRGIIYAWDNDNQRQSYVMLTIHFQKRREITWELKEIGQTKKIVTPIIKYIYSLKLPASNVIPICHTYKNKHLCEKKFLNKPLYF